MVTSVSERPSTPPSADTVPPAVDLDHAATTRPRPEALAASAPFREHRYGNPSGTHALARDAVRALDEAREQVAEVLGRDPGEIVFTSGGTESDVHAVTGGLPAQRNHLDLGQCLQEVYLTDPSVGQGLIPNDPELPLPLDKVHPLHEVVKIDYFLPGCPPSADAIWKFLNDLLAGRTPQLGHGLIHYD